MNIKTTFLNSHREFMYDLKRRTPKGDGFILEPGPQTLGSEAALESIKRTKEQLDYCFVSKDEVDFCCASACLPNFFVGKYCRAKIK